MNKDTSTLEEFISTGHSSDNQVTYYSTSILECIDNKIYFNYENIIFDYIEELIAASINITLSDSELELYKYRPDLLSYHIYNTINYDFIILAINSIQDPKDFCTSNIKLIKPDDLATLLSHIVNAEKKYIQLNRTNLNI